MLRWTREERAFGRPRSPQWPRVRREHLSRQPACAVCGETRQVEVHHIYPVHLFPERELDPSNLVTLCEKFHHHLLFGHCMDWRSFNENVLQDVEWAMRMIYHRREK